MGWLARGRMRSVGGGRWGLLLSLALIVAAGAAAQPPSSLVTITDLILDPARDGRARLEIAADGPLAWTTYRTLDKDLVVELVGALPAPAVNDLELADGLVERITVTRAAANLTGEPMTRLTIETRREAVHSLETATGVLRLTLFPSVAEDDGDSGSGEPPAPTPATPAPVAPADETPADEEPADEELAGEAPAGEIPAGDDAPRTREPAIEEETLDDEPAPAPAEEPADPVRSEETGAPAPLEDAGAPAPLEDAAGPAEAGDVLGAPPSDALLAIETTIAEAGVVVRLIGNGRLDFAQLSLPQPPRFVIDLHGVIHRVSPADLPLESDLVARVRVGQFQVEPRPITRVVLDLEHGGLEPRVERAGDHLVIRVSRP